MRTEPQAHDLYATKMADMPAEPRRILIHEDTPDRCVIAFGQMRCRRPVSETIDGQGLCAEHAFKARVP